MGMYTVMSITQGGCGLPCLSQPFFDYLLRGQYTGIIDRISPASIPIMDLRFTVEKVNNLYSGDS